MSDDYLATISTAGTITLARDGSGSISGQIETSLDRDWFKVTLTAGQTYLLGVETVTTGGLVDPYLWLHDAAGALVNANDDGGDGLDALLRFAPTTSGDYFLEAGAYGTGLGGYLVTVRTDNSIPDTGTSTDDYGATTSTTGVVAVGGSASGRIETGADRDWFGVVLAAGQVYSFTLASAGLDGLSDPYLSLYSSSGTLLGSNDDGAGNLNSLLSYATTAAGTYYLQARDYGSGTGAYRLAASATAQIDSMPPTVVNFSPADEAGAVATTSNIVLTFSEAIQRGTGTIALRTAAGTLIESYDVAGSIRLTLAGSTLTLDPVTALSDGTAYRVEFSAGSIRDLAGNLYAGTTTYNFTTAAAPAIADDYAANSGTNGRLLPGGSVNGHIETSGDRDWFGITLAAGQRYSLSLNAGTPNGLADPYLSLYSATGTLLAANDDGGSGNPLNSLITYTPTTSGTFYLEARDYRTGLGTYNLSASGSTPSDTTAPLVLNFSPADESVSAQVTGNIVVTFNEPIQRGTGNIVLKTANGAVVESYDAATSIRLGLAGTVMTLDPSAALASGSAYRVEFAPGTVRDITGNPYAGTTSYNFTTAAAPMSDDYAGSTATTGRLSLGSGVSGRIETANDTDWFAVTLSAGQTYTFGLDGIGSAGLGDPLLAIFSSTGTLLAYDDDSGSGYNSLLSFRPVASGTYYLQASHYGSGLGAYTLSASGSAQADVTAPVVVSFSPADEAASVALSANIMLTFSEAIQRGSGAILLKTSAGALVESFDAATSLRLSVAGSVLTVDPTAALTIGTGYRLEFAAATIKDLAGNVYAGTTSYNFATVGDTSAPTVVSFTPADEASAVALDSNIVVTFNESIQRGTGTIMLKTSAGALIESFDARTSARLSLSGTVLTLDPSASLASGSAYRVEFMAGTVADIAGNGYAGTTTYNFSTLTTTSSDDFTANTTTTGRLAAGSSASGRIETTSDSDWFAITLSAGQIYTFTLDGTASGGLSDPYLTLRSGTGSQLAYDDDGGTNYGSRLVYSPATTGTFYLEARHYGSGTGAYTLSASGATQTDTTAPTVISFSPADEASAVSPTSNIVLTFSERIERGTGTIALRTSAGTLVESFDAASSTRLSVAGSTLTLDPTAALAGGTGYRIEFSAGNVRDLAGNPYAGTTSYNFSTQGDITAPTVTRFSPTDEAVSVAIGSNIVLTFSEAIQRGAGTVLLKTVTGTLIESFDAASSARLSLSGATLTLDPTAMLANGTAYKVEFAPGSIRDLAGNAYAGTTAYNFTTVTAASVDDYSASASTTGQIAIGASASGRIEISSDRDWFAVSLTAGQTYTFRLNAAISNGLSDPYLSLYGATGTLLATNDDGDTGYNSLISYTANSSGTFYLEARHYGSGVGAYTLQASADAPPAPGASAFTIAINYSGSAAYQSYFDQAAARWAQIIIGDLPNVSSSRGVIDDLLIDASVTAIDGVGNVLGQAGFTAIRSAGLPYLGVMEFDEADIAQLVANGTFGSIVLHEMGHVLGLSGYLWQQRGLVSTANPYIYNGANAVAAYDSLSPATPTSVPLESGGGSGTAGSHWSEAVFNKELMTGYAESAPPMPISIITIGALADLGYLVNYAAADAFSL